MPDLDTKLHLAMLEDFKKSNVGGVYGQSWGDPEQVEPLRYILSQYVMPFVDRDKVVLEIGPGGGRWTKYLLNCRHLYAVDYHDELLDELRKNYNYPHMAFIKNNGTDFPGIEANSIDYLFSFGTFVHLELHLIQSYLKNIRSIIKPKSPVVIQYGDKTKEMGMRNQTFPNNTPEIMRKMVTDSGYKIIREDLTTLWHSSVIQFTRII